MSSRPSPAEILAHFPGPVTLRPSYRRWLLVLLTGVILGGGGILMIADGDRLGWFPAIFFGLCAVVAVAAMLPGAGFLRLDSEGFEFASLYRRNRVRWQDASGFEAARIPPSYISLVAFDQATMTRHSLARFNRSIIGRNAALSDTYGYAASELAGVMAQWRERALERR